MIDLALTKESIALDFAAARTKPSPTPTPAPELELAKPSGTSGTSGTSGFSKTGSGDPQLCEEYVEEIDKYTREIETKYAVRPDYMSSQPEINVKMRAILVDWLVDVHIRFKLLPETLFLAVNITDRYLAKERVTRQKLQLVGITALLIACKYEEIYPPELKDFAYITDNAYTTNEILSMEQLLLSGLGFNLNVPLGHRFLQRYCQISGDKGKTRHLAQYLTELPLIEAHMLKYPSSTISAAALYVSRKLLSKDDPWTPHIANAVGYSQAELKPCARDLLVLLQLARKSTLQAVRKKFTHARFMEVGQLRIGRKD